MSTLTFNGQYSFLFLNIFNRNSVFLTLINMHSPLINNTYKQLLIVLIYFMHKICFIPCKVTYMYKKKKR